MADRSQWPPWVSIGLIGIHNAATAWFFVAFCVVGAIAGVFYAITGGDPRAWAALALIPAAGWYFLAIDWVESNSSWD